MMGFGGIGSSNPGGFTEFNGSLYFSAKDGNGMELWKTDGTASGTVIVKDIYPGSDNYFGESASSNPSGFTVFDGALLFQCHRWEWYRAMEERWHAVWHR